MSGALIELISKGVQDTFLTSPTASSSFFKLRYTKHTNFSQKPKQLEFVGGTVSNGGSSVIQLKSFGDLVNGLWLEGSGGDLVTNLSGTTFDLYIGGQLVDSQTFDYCADIWQIYLAETYSKSSTINNLVSQSDAGFFPLHFFFCDNGLFLPLIAMQYHEVEIRINWGSSVSSATDVKCFANYIYLDTDERTEMVAKPQGMDILVTQVQKLPETATSGVFELSALNHPVKSLYFGLAAEDAVIATDYWSFSSADLYLNGVDLLDSMSPSYFHTVQGYYNTQYGVLNFDTTLKCPFYTRYFTYNFCLDATKYTPTGSCNFSRLDNAKLVLKDIVKGSDRTGDSLTLYAVNYNILRVKQGMAGILFGN